MEGTLQLLAVVAFILLLAGFNPCFSGRYSAIKNSRLLMKINVKGFNPCFSGRYSAIKRKNAKLEVNKGFNPCFSGRYSAILRLMYYYNIQSVFQSLF